MGERTPLTSLSFYGILFRMQEEALLDVRDVGRILKLSPQAIYTRISRGGDLPPSLLLGKLRRWRIETVRTWLADKEKSESGES